MFKVTKIKFLLRKENYKSHLLYKITKPCHYSLYPMFYLKIEDDNFISKETEIIPIAEDENHIIYSFEDDNLINTLPPMKVFVWEIFHITGMEMDRNYHIIPNDTCFNDFTLGLNYQSHGEEIIIGNKRQLYFCCCCSIEFI